MPYPTWPSSLPCPDREGWQVRPQEARRSRQSDAGPPAYRRRFSAAAKMVAAQFLFTRDQKAAFERFYEIDTLRGSGLFWMPDPTTSGWPLWSHSADQLLTGLGQPILLAGRWLCLFGDELWTESVMGTRFRISCQFVVMP